MTDLADFVALVGGDRGLGVVSTLRPDTTIQSSVVNVGVLPHPVTGEQVVAFVSQGRARRLGYLRARPRATVVLRSGWQWAAAEGPVLHRRGRDARRLGRLRRRHGGRTPDRHLGDPGAGLLQRLSLLTAPGLAGLTGWDP